MLSYSIVLIEQDCICVYAVTLATLSVQVLDAGAAVCSQEHWSFVVFRFSVHLLQVIITEAANHFVVPDSVCDCSLCHDRY